jgi:hypothetical protein
MARRDTLDFTIQAWEADHPAGYREWGSKPERPKGRWRLVARFSHFQHALDFRNQIVNNGASVRVGSPDYTRPRRNGGHAKSYDEMHPKPERV